MCIGSLCLCIRISAIKCFDSVVSQTNTITWLLLYYVEKLSVNEIKQRVSFHQWPGMKTLQCLWLFMCIGTLWQMLLVFSCLRHKSHIIQTPCILSDTTHRFHPEEQELLQMIRWSRMQDNSRNTSQKCENTPSKTLHLSVIFWCQILHGSCSSIVSADLSIVRELF